jgi:7-keto-8-aminopelargonate synthetase-like enzyme
MISPEHQLVDALMAEGVANGLIHLLTEDTVYDGRTIKLEGRAVLNFGSCSYLNLQHEPALVDGAIDALRRYGTQFSSSRAYVRTTLYGEVESLLGDLFGAPPIVTPSTTLAHLSAIPVLLGPDDAALIDRQSHHSLQTAVSLAAVRGTKTETVSHNDLDALRERVAALSRTHDRVWFLCDSLYSMYGDFAPLGLLMTLVDEFPQLHLYVDDAHASGWFGHHGRGYAAERLERHPRTAIATSLSKSFAANGGALIIHDPELRRAVLHCGGPLTFSGPLPPPVLGALAASARLHLSDEHGLHQRALHDRMAYAARRSADLGLPMINAPGSPVRFIALGDEGVMHTMARGLRTAGYWTNSAGFPAVPQGRSGIRFTLNNGLTLDDIDGFLRTVATLYPQCLDAAGQTPAAAEQAFVKVRQRLNYSTLPAPRIEEG